MSQSKTAILMVVEEELTQQMLTKQFFKILQSIQQVMGFMEAIWMILT